MTTNGLSTCRRCSKFKSGVKFTGSQGLLDIFNFGSYFRNVFRRGAEINIFIKGYI